MPLRRATGADTDRLIEIRAAVRENRLADRSRVTRGDYCRRISAGRVWVAEVDGTVAGFAAADPEDGTIWALFVDPAREGHGHGRALLDAACVDLAEAGCRQASLTTDAGTRAERLYRWLGWRDMGVVGLSERRFTLALTDRD